MSILGLLDDIEGFFFNISEIFRHLPPNFGNMIARRKQEIQCTALRNILHIDSSHFEIALMVKFSEITKGQNGPFWQKLFSQITLNKES